jgi:hypothetical protein
MTSTPTPSPGLAHAVDPHSSGGASGGHSGGAGGDETGAGGDETGDVDGAGTGSTGSDTAGNSASAASAGARGANNLIIIATAVAVAAVVAVVAAVVIIKGRKGLTARPRTSVARTSGTRGDTFDAGVVYESSKRAPAPTESHVEGEAVFEI